MKMMSRMMTFNKLRMVVTAVLFCGLFTKAMAQTGRRYAEPVFEEVNVESGIPFSSVIEEGETSPITLYLDFYEPQGDTLSARPLVITVFGGAFVAGGRDYVDMVEYCTRLAQHGYAAASIDYRLLSIWNLNATSLVRDAYMAAQAVSSAIRFFKCHSEEYRIDPEQVFLLGNSAGSIAILCEMFMDESERPAETYESPDLGSMHSSGYEEYAGFSPAVAGAIPHWGGVLDLDVISTEEYVPLCMIHGTDDTTVPYDSGYCYNGMLPGVMPFMYGSHAMVSRLDELDVTDYEFHSFEDEGHAFYLNVIGQLNEAKFNACFDITRDFLYNHLKFPTSLPEMGETMIQVYPNPAPDLLTISVGNATQSKPLSVTVIDVMGQVVFVETVSDTEMSLDVSCLPSGIYFIRLEQEDFWGTRKIVKR